MRGIVIFAAIVQLGLGCANGYDPYFEGWCQSRRIHKDKGPSFNVQMAQKQCEMDNANLISFHSIERNNLYMNDYEGLMIGVVCNNRTNRFEWTDGSSWNFTNFADHKYADANYACDTHQSFALNSIGQWVPWEPQFDDYYHEEDSFYLCLGYRLLDSPCDAFNVMKTSNGDQCYLLGEWKWSAQDAEKSCGETIHIDAQTKLISIHDEQSNAFLRRYLLSNIAQPVEGAYIGLRRALNFTLYWTDGTPVDYTNFAKHGSSESQLLVSNAKAATPDDDDVETCYMLRISDGKWVAVNCYPFGPNHGERPGLCGRAPFSFPPQPAGCPAKTDYRDGEEFFSPSYPLSGNFGPAHCQYTMTARPGEAVLFEVVRIEANRCCDTLNLYNNDGKFLDSWFGYDISQEPGLSVYGAYEKLIMVWNSTNPTGTRGFHVKVMSVPMPKFFEMQRKQLVEKKMKELAHKKESGEDPVDVE